MGRRGRSSDPRFHQQGGDGRARRPARPSTPSSAAFPSCARRCRDYYARHFGITLPVEHFFVTGSGMQAIQIAVQALTSPGDEIGLSDAGLAEYRCCTSRSLAPVRSASSFDFEGGKWAIDLDRIEDGDHAEDQGALHQHAVQPDGLDRDEARTSPPFWRLPASTMLWIMADEIYARYYYPRRPCAVVP